VAADLTGALRAWLGLRLDRSIGVQYARQALRAWRYPRAYQRWIRAEQASIPSTASQRREHQSWRYRPLMTVLMAVHNPRREWLKAAILSVLSQTYERWQLCICDDGSKEQWVQEYLGGLQDSHPRVETSFLGSSVGISGALNVAGNLAKGDYVGFLDHDDLLAPATLHYIVQALQAKQAGLLYSDEDAIDESGKRWRPNFKPDWSPHLLESCNYVNHFMAIRHELITRVGWFRSECDGAQDYDLALRATDDPGVAVTHVARILYHWRKHSESTLARTAAKTHTHLAGKRALTDAMSRRGFAAIVEDSSQPNTYSSRRVAVGGEPVVSLVICSRTPRLLESCLSSIRKRTRYGHYEIVVVHHQTSDNQAAITEIVNRFQCKRVIYSGSFNFARMNNLGVKETAGEYILFLNDDTKVIDERWLAAMASRLGEDGVGIVGAKLLYRSGALQHAGIAVNGLSGASHPGRASFGSLGWNWFQMTRELSAVTGACLAIKRMIFDQVGGFDEGFSVDFNDIDLCMKVRAARYQVIIENRAVIQHDECGTRVPGRLTPGAKAFVERWRPELTNSDRFWSRHLKLDETMMPDPRGFERL
jgi:GT2 family glycosyltransferase